MGATSILNVLDAGSGAVVWSRNAASDTGAELPGWGFAGSPLVAVDVVIVATAGKLDGIVLLRVVRRIAAVIPSDNVHRHCIGQ